MARISALLFVSGVRFTNDANAHDEPPKIHLVSFD